MPRESMLAASGRREALELLAQERRGALHAVELAVAVAAEEPGVPGPVAGVVAHRDQERDPRGDEVADQRQQDEPDDQVDRERQRVDVEDRHVGMGDEEKERGVQADQVPLEDGAGRHVAEDEAVQQQDEDHADDEQRCRVR